MVGRVVLCNGSPACTVKYRQSTLHATLSLTPTPCKSMHGGLGFHGESLDLVLFHGSPHYSHTAPARVLKLRVLLSVPRFGPPFSKMAAV